MPEPQPIHFVPKWLREASAEELIVLSGSAYGSAPPDFPRLVTRILPKNRGCTLSALSLSETLRLEQSLALHAARDVIYEPNPDFADLRSLSGSVMEFAKLTIEPFEEGSFVIPARLEAVPFRTVESTPAVVETGAILDRLMEMMDLLRTPRQATGVSIGALQTIESFGRVLNREAECIEIVPYDTHGNSLRRTEIRPETVSVVKGLLAKRRSSEQPLEQLRGRLTALDTETNAFQLNVLGQRQRVKGFVMAFHMPWMRERLGRSVRLEGIVERSGRRIVSLTVHRVVEADDEPQQSPQD